MTHFSFSIMKHFSAVLTMVGWALVSTASGQFDETKVVSPDGKVAASIQADHGQLECSVDVSYRPILRPSLLGLSIAGEKPLGIHAQILGTESRDIDESWLPVTGKVRVIHNRAKEITVHLQDTGDETPRAFDLVVRAYNDGVAWRYVLPKAAGKEEVTINGELTQFGFPEDEECWYADHQHFNTSQESPYASGKVSTIPEKALIGMPLLLKFTPHLYAALTEADVTHWAGMRFMRGGKQVVIRAEGHVLRSGEEKGQFASTVVERRELPGVQVALAQEDQSAPLVKVTLPAQSPWRVVMIGRTPGDLIQSNLIENLNPPSEIADTSWIKPGIAAWDWWSGRSEMRTDSIKKFIQLAADMGWPYMLIDAGWYYHEDQADGDLLRVSDGLDMDEVRRFAKEKGVRLWLWMSWRDVMRNDAYKRAFPLFEQWGIAGVKIDYMNREDQWMVDWYHQVFRETAAHHLMLDLHGAYKPTGARRTWPNFITQEGVLGNEYNRSTREDTARHNVTIPYTRGLLGPMDYTPGGFVNQTPAQFSPTEHGTTVPNTRGQELAKFVVFESPLMMACDYPDNYRDQPGADFLKVVKTSWDEVRWLSGEVGESVVLARRSGAEWFVGGMTNESARSVEVRLAAFLEEGKRYRLTVWKDAPGADKDATKLVKEEREVGAGDVETVAMAPAGGFVMRVVAVGE